MFTMLREDSKPEQAQQYLSRLQRYIEKHGQQPDRFEPQAKTGGK